MLSLLVALSQAFAAGTDFVMLSRNGIDAQVFDGLNAAHGTDLLSLYNSSWGTSINPNAFNILIRVNDDKVSFVRAYNSTGAVLIPANNWVIAANGVELPWLSGLAKEDHFFIRPTHTCESASHAVPVIMFHDLGTDGANFEATLQAIQSDGYQTITLEQFRDYLNGENPDLTESHPILLTFDDGYDSQFSFAPGLLDAYGMVGTIFVITSFPGNVSFAATWSEIETAVAQYPDAIQIGCHSHNAHFQTNGVARYLLMTEAERQADIATCISTIETHTGRTPIAMSWPFGSHDVALIGDAKDAGLELTMSTWPGLNHPKNSDPTGEVRRYGANVDTGWLATKTEMDRWYVCENR